MEVDLMKAWLAPGVSALTAAVDLTALLLGWWWATFVAAAVAAGLLVGKRIVAAVLVGTLVAWGISLPAQAGARTIDVADLVGALALNTRGLGWLVIVVTLVYALLLALAGTWLGAAARRLRARRRSAAGSAGEIHIDVGTSDDKTEEAQHV
jgi:uncharacterized oligopeptide transporter (OPT) family protein